MLFRSELWNRVSLWRFTWRYAYDRIPLLPNRVKFRDEFHRFVDKEALPVLAEHSDEIEPLDRVYFDGRESYDPSIQPPDDPTALPYYSWTVLEAPDGAAESDFDWIGDTTALPSM